MNTVYQTQPGTIPHRAINHLKSLPDGSMLSTAELTEAIGAQANGFTTCMRPARECGMVHTSFNPEQRNIMYWHLHIVTKFVRPAIPKDEPKAVAPAAPAPPAVTPAPAKNLSMPAIDASKAPTPAPRPPAPEPEPKKPACPAAARHFRAGLFTDKSMLLEVGTERFELLPDEVEAIKQLTWNRP